jgi:VWFA-related protein
MHSNDVSFRAGISLRTWPFVALIVLLLSSSARSQQPAVRPSPTPADSDVVKISTNLIQLDVTVVDSRGRVVKDLRPDEIEIYENGKKQAITNFAFISSARPTSPTDPPRQAAKAAADKEPVASPVQQIRPEQVRRTIAIVVDDLSLSAESAYNTRRALRKFVNEQMLDGDFVAIVRTGASEGTLQQFTSDRVMLNAAVERVRWNPSGLGGMTPFAAKESSFAEIVEAEMGRPVASSSASSDGFNPVRSEAFAIGTLGALQFVVEGMKELPGRKSVVLFSEGWQLFDPSAFAQSDRVNGQLGKLIDTANRADAVFYTIDARGVQYTGITAADQLTVPSPSRGSIVPTPQRMAGVMTQRNSDLWWSQLGLDLLAKETGGFSTKNTNDLAGGIRKFLEDQSYYLVGYEPDEEAFDAASRKFNKIEVRVLRKGLTARHRSGFFNMTDETAAKQPAPQRGAPETVLRQALMSPFAVNDIPVSLNALYGNARNGDYVRSLLHIDAKALKFTDEPDGSKKAVFDVWAAGFGGSGLPVDQIRKTYTLSVNGDGFKKVLDEGFVYYFVSPVKKPGPYQYRVAIRDSQSGKAGSASQFIQVPNIRKGRLTASSMMLESFTAQEWEKLMDPRSSPNRSNTLQDTALRQVKLGSILRYGFEVYNPRSDTGKPPSLQARTRVFLEGKMVMDGQPVAVDLTGQSDTQRVTVSGAINLLSSMEPGDYILQVIVTDNLAKRGQNVVTQHIQFEIAN